jgi:hypothetical protein
MNIKGIDYKKEKKYELVAEVNVFKKKVKILEKEPKETKVVVSVPFNLTTFRVYKFPVKDNDKIKNLVKGQLQFDIPIPLEELEYDFYLKDDTAFCVITKKSVIEEIKETYQKVDILDSEIFSIIRLMNFKGENSGKVIHFSSDYAYYLEFEDNFPKMVHALSDKDLDKFLSSDTFLSGEIPESLKEKHKILNNPTKNPALNIAFGNILRGIFDETGIDFLHKEKADFTSYIVKGLIYFMIALFFINAGIYAKIFFLQEKIKEVKNKEKEIFIKYFSSSTPVFDPLTQAKGLVSSVENRKTQTIDALDILDDVGKAKMKTRIKELYKINIGISDFTIQGIAESLKDVENFKNELSKKYQVIIEESVTNTEGKIRFSIKGKLK